MGIAAQVRSFRVRAGKSASEVAHHVGLNDAWYHDLEQNDEELASTLTLFQAIELASALGARLHDLVGEAAPRAAVPLMDLPSLIRAHLARAGISLEELEEQVGWDLQELMQAPLKVAAESPIAFFQAVAGHLGIDWLSLVPDEAAE
jgi:transcriptional regulator with XRE-family HTH domain